MKKLKNKTLNFANIIWASLLSLLGFTACKTGSEIGNGEVICMYGVPTASLSMTGTVVNEQGSAIKGIQVKVTTDSDVIAEPILTDEQGKFAVNSSYFYAESVNIISTDVDGDENGAYQTDSTNVPLTYEGASGWNSGTAKVDKTITLKEKK